MMLLGSEALEDLILADSVDLDDLVDLMLIIFLMYLEIFSEE